MNVKDQGKGRQRLGNGRPKAGNGRQASGKVMLTQAELGADVLGRHSGGAQLG
jgi:hypothetical protein